MWARMKSLRLFCNFRTYQFCFIFAYREIPDAVESLKDVINTPDLLLRSVIHCMQIIDPSKH